MPGARRAAASMQPLKVVFLLMTLVYLLQRRDVINLQVLHRPQLIAEPADLQRYVAALMHGDERPRVVAIVRVRQLRLGAAGRIRGRAGTHELVVEPGAARADDYLVRRAGVGTGGVRVLRDVHGVLMTAEVGGVILRDDAPEGVTES